MGLVLNSRSWRYGSVWVKELFWCMGVIATVDAWSNTQKTLCENKRLLSFIFRLCHCAFRCQWNGRPTGDGCRCFAGFTGSHCETDCHCEGHGVCSSGRVVTVWWTGPENPPTTTTAGTNLREEALRALLIGQEQKTHTLHFFSPLHSGRVWWKSTFEGRHFVPSSDVTNKSRTCDKSIKCLTRQASPVRNLYLLSKEHYWKLTWSNLIVTFLLTLPLSPLFYRFFFFFVLFFYFLLWVWQNYLYLHTYHLSHSVILFSDQHDDLNSTLQVKQVYSIFRRNMCLRAWLEVVCLPKQVRLGLQMWWR